MHFLRRHRTAVLAAIVLCIPALPAAAQSASGSMSHPAPAHSAMAGNAMAPGAMGHDSAAPAAMGHESVSGRGAMASDGPGHDAMDYRPMDRAKVSAGTRQRGTMKRAKADSMKHSPR